MMCGAHVYWSFNFSKFRIPRADECPKEILESFLVLNEIGILIKIIVHRVHKSCAERERKVYDEKKAHEAHNIQEHVRHTCFQM